MLPFKLRLTDSYTREILDSIPPGLVFWVGFIYLNWESAQEGLKVDLDAVSRVLVISLGILAVGYLLRLVFGALPVLGIGLMGSFFGYRTRSYTVGPTDRAFWVIAARFFEVANLPVVVNDLDKPDGPVREANFNSYYALLQARFGPPIPVELMHGPVITFGLGGACWLLAHFHPGRVPTWMFVTLFVVASLQSLVAGWLTGLQSDRLLASKMIEQLEPK